MSRTMILVLALSIAAFAVPAQQPSQSIDADRQAKLEKIRKLTPEERQKLVDRLNKIKQLPPEEKERLDDNLKKLKALPAEEQKQLAKKVQQLAPEDKKAYSEMASGLFHEVRKRDPNFLKDFPRGAFFNWLTKEKSEDMARIRNLEPDVRKEAFTRFYFEFQQVARKRLLNHTRKHKCVPESDLEDLMDLTVSDYWARWQRILRACPDRQKRPAPNGNGHKK